MDAHFWGFVSGSKQGYLFVVVFSAVKFGCFAFLQFYVRHMFHEHKPKVDVFTFTIIIQFYMSILNTPTILGLLFNGCIQTAIGFFQTTQTHPWSDPDDAQIDSVLSAETLADLLSVLEP